jgi:GH25 family lysozyme M1 (1,4-beta-N-acetylmuramidase)
MRKPMTTALAALTFAMTALAGGTALASVPGDLDHAGSGLSSRTARPVTPSAIGPVRGLDVSGYQENVDWPSVVAAGASFAYVKATEGLTYTSSYFAQQYDGSARVGLIRGAYHFARPDTSSGSAQADYFLDHGGTWRADGTTLPGALDIEYNPHGDTCYGLGAAAMVSWIGTFSARYRARAGRAPVIYSTADWWRRCTGDSAAFASANPLWIAGYSGTPLPLPHGWTTYTIWQYADSGTLPGDQNTFNGTRTDLRTFATGDYAPPPVRAWPLVQQGQAGGQVTTVQYLLDARGAALEVDGSFGPATRSAVQSFQAARGLEADGIVGPATWPELAVTVQTGASGPAVQAVQAQLDARGSALPVDGQYTDTTRAAVIGFQRANQLTADGVVGPETWQALVS